MKLIVFIPLLLLGTILQAQDIEVESLPRGKRCVILRQGTCYVDINVKGSVSFRKSKKGEFFLKVYRGKITSEEETIMFGKKLVAHGKDVFIMDEPYSLSEKLRVALGLEGDAIIPIGEYPVEITMEIIEIKLIIEKK
ncbi:MAG: hypothetical protein ABJQ39_13750 [Winogradskyella arenosi]